MNEKYFSDIRHFLVNFRNVNRLVLLTRSCSSLAIASFLGIAYYAFQNKKAKRALIDRVETDGQFKASAFKLTNYKGYVVSEDSVMSGTLEKVSQMQVQNEDIFVASFPKSGTTWLQQVVYLLYNPDDTSEESQIMEWKFPYLEHVYPGLNEIENRLGDRRFIKTHLPIGKKYSIFFSLKLKDFFLIFLQSCYLQIYPKLKFYLFIEIPKMCLCLIISLQEC